MADQEHATATEKAEAKSADAERATETLYTAKRRLSRRAAARRRRAIAAGEEPEELEEAPPAQETPRAVYPPWHTRAGQEIS